MQIAWLKLKLFDSAAGSCCLYVNVEEKRRVKLSQNFPFFLSYIAAVINSFKTIKILMDNVYEE